MQEQRPKPKQREKGCKQRRTSWLRTIVDNGCWWRRRFTNNRTNVPDERYIPGKCSKVKLRSYPVWHHKGDFQKIPFFTQNPNWYGILEFLEVQCPLLTQPSVHEGLIFHVTHVIVACRQCISRIAQQNAFWWLQYTRHQPSNIPVESYQVQIYYDPSRWLWKNSDARCRFANFRVT